MIKRKKTKYTINNYKKDNKMPSTMIKNFSKKSGKTEQEVENIWIIMKEL